MAYISKLTILLSSDLMFLFVVFVIFFAFAMYFGRARTVSFILSFYPATLLYKSFPFFDKLTVLGVPGGVWAKFAIFLIIFVPINIILAKYISSDSFYIGSSGVLRNAGYSVAILIMIILFSYGTINFDALHNFSPVIDAIFGDTNKMFWWNLAPLALLAVL